MSEDALPPAWAISIAHALASYRSLGLTPIPLQPRGKRPIAKGWLDNPDRAWRRAPNNPNVGILTGEPSNGLVVIDIDEPQALPRLFDLSLRQLRKRTLVVQTGSGLHVYARQLGLRSTKLPHGAGDLQANGKQVVAPYSIHPSGAIYRFISSAATIAPLGQLRPRFDPSTSAGRDEAPTQGSAGAGCVEASTSPASPDLESRAEAFVASQALRFRRQVARLRRDQVDDRSGAEFMLAKGLAEADFTFNEICSILTSWGPKAQQRGDEYVHRTVTRAMRSAGKTPHRGEEVIESR